MDIIFVLYTKFNYYLLPNNGYNIKNQSEHYGYYNNN